mgnify:CR=1 FL=1
MNWLYGEFDQKKVDAVAGVLRILFEDLNQDERKAVIFEALNCEVVVLHNGIEAVIHGGIDALIEKSRIAQGLIVEHYVESGFNAADLRFTDYQFEHIHLGTLNKTERRLRNIMLTFDSIVWYANDLRKRLEMGGKQSAAA